MKILIIDDSALSRNMFKKALGPEHTYLEAPDGMRGLELYFLEKPDLVILDLTMPGTRGMDILSQIRQMDPHSKVLVGTADVQESTRHEATALGAVGLINKPFTSENVQQAVRMAIGEGA